MSSEPLSFIDYFVFGLYMTAVLAVGFHHFRKNKTIDDYYVGNRKMGSTHIGLSVVATDVGGGFSIGLGGLGFAMGLSGSWLLFTGLIGAWMTAVFIIPKIKAVDRQNKMFTYPDFLRHRFDERVALLAALISGIGYLGFTGAQILAGAKLASATLFTRSPFGFSPLQFSLLLIAIITVTYTVIGGLKAVVYTDTIQWIILLAGLICITLPVTLFKIGGWSALKTNLPAEFFHLTNLDWVTFINWMVTILPIWLIGMTLYQRMYACRNEKEAKKAWFIAGLFEYPIMAFTGVFLGMCARVVFPEVESEMGLPFLIKDILPVGIAGIVIASYFSAIMSTADSCLMASSGNFVNDIIQRHFLRNPSKTQLIRISQIVTFLIGILAVLLASQFEKVLDAILHAYAFMVSGLFIPTLGAFFWKKGSSTGAFWAMLLGGSVTILLLTNVLPLPGFLAALKLHASLYGILVSACIFVSISHLVPDKEAIVEGQTSS